MKTRATSFLLAALAVVSLVLPALAAEPDDLPLETPAKSEEIEKLEELRSTVVLDGEPAESVEFEILDGVCYVTVNSFVSLMDAEAMVEEESGAVSVNASAVIGVAPLSSEASEAEESETEDAEAAEEGEGVESTENAANVVTDDLNLQAAAGTYYLVANGRYLYTEDGLIQLNGRVAAPVRLLARVYNLDVGYDAKYDLVLLERQEDAEPYLDDAAYDNDTLYWLSHIIYAESGNQPLTGKIAVGNVVMNRVNDPRFPNSVYDVLFQKNQFTPASSGSIYRDPNWESTLAAMLVMDGAEVTDALFFNGVRARAPKGRTYVATIGDHAFYK